MPQLALGSSGLARVRLRTAPYVSEESIEIEEVEERTVLALDAEGLEFAVRQFSQDVLDLRACSAGERVGEAIVLRAVARNRRLRRQRVES
jgi:hypothetical protein